MGENVIRRFNRIDQLLNEVQRFLDTLSHAPRGADTPAFDLEESALNALDQRKSQGFMRVNHCGEICAQALYRGQAFGTNNAELKQHFDHAAQEEMDHLEWCHTRLKELESRPSFLNPLWYLGSFMMGVGAARLGDALSLGFVEETEKQVVRHLEQHEHELPVQDLKSRAIVATMKADEARHAADAQASGAQTLPAFLKLLMKLQSKVMTTTAYYF